ncbi:hypothetical protein, conserved [Trypanosoma brucei gambiense DAL972]|uniref:Uncharacterized protein n=1 Tax=Trypanosoma brucei gambiense (strain MHOM/CI/86/DAL972) TaxID=679716 RepID=D0A3M7_TRYB9|nr:hypothetical protein, conserved [Trypanosoma brucei gambiense DAL972]CBH15871.1 hypothetical protein, conserved [Trypanosoma brucei gambiense DAL972]|eukprot:XP_011778135.1 hypothetical protein, conserved [Trypanosoma brucei gambiense DAL972]
MTVSEASASTYANKREVLDRIKEVLEDYVQLGVIDREDFKKLAKTSADVLPPPVAAEEVMRKTLRQLVEFLNECGAEETVIAPIRAAMEAIKKEQTKQIEKEEKREDKAAPLLSLSALRERMSRKREELRRQREETDAANDAATARHEVIAASSGPAAAAVAVAVAEPKPESAAGNGEPRAKEQRTETSVRAPMRVSREVDLYADLVTATNRSR